MWPVLAVTFTLSQPNAEAPAATNDKAPTALQFDQALKKARVEGKYVMLLRQFKAPADFKKHSAFADLGAQARTEWRGVKNLPRGYWVYVYPHWYIWRDLVETNRQKRGYGPEQAASAPDTPLGVDSWTAWASKSADGQSEWLHLEFSEPVVPAKLKIYENYCPGAVTTITAFDHDGKEVSLWKGVDPSPAGKGQGVSEIALKTDLKTNRVRIHLDSQAVRGWNEIDAVGLIDKQGRTQWARAVAASSTWASGWDQGFAARGGQAMVLVPADQKRRMVALEKEVVELKAQMAEFEKLRVEVVDLKAQVAELGKLRAEMAKLHKLKSEVERILKDRRPKP